MTVCHTSMMLSKKGRTSGVSTVDSATGLRNSCRSTVPSLPDELQFSGHHKDRFRTQFRPST